MNYKENTSDEFKTKKELIEELNSLRNSIKSFQSRNYNNEERGSEKLYRAVFHNSPLGIFHFNEDGIIFDCNEKFIGIMGSSRSALIGFNMLERLKNEKLKAVITSTLNGVPGGYFEGEYVSVTGNKSSFVRVFSNNIATEDGKFLGGIGLVEDISEQRKTQAALGESERNYKELFESANDAIVIFEPVNEIILEINDRACKMYGLSRDELIGSSLKNYTKNIENGRLIIHELLRERSIEDYETIHFDKNGKEIYLLSNASLIEYKGRDAVLSIGRDISERKRTDAFILMLAQALRSTSECVTITDMEDKLLFANAAFLKTYGFEENELYGRGMSILRSPNNSEEITREILPKTLAGGWKGELLNQRKDGTEFPIYLSTSVVLSDEGSPLALIGVAKDISEQKSIESQLRKLSYAVEQSPSTIIITDITGKIEYVNPIFTKTTGFSYAEIISQNVRILKSGMTPQENYKNLWSSISSGNQWRGEFHNKKKSGELYYEFASISPIVNDKGKITGYIAVKEDITERKNAELELIKAKEKAQESDRLKTEFLAQMSHEIRTPINTILNFIYLIKADLQNIMDEDLQISFNAIENGSRRLIRTIDLILNMSQVQTGYIELNNKIIDIQKEILHPLVSEFLSTARSKGLKLEYNNATYEKCFIKVDKYTTMQIFINLLENAIKYTTTGEVKIRMYNTEDEKIGVDVIDTGIGISNEYLDKIFTPFSQEEMGYTRQFEGNGLGLALVKKYCELNNIEILVRSKKGSGSTFTVIFPTFFS